ncbi:metal ABC transporter ATP-binding protein [Streptomyces sp. N2-109]|uniref:Metal ABC transporter ATP-binding protein n=1 Tax=Streptomyces gossypii TaxID=2883101 RepID=A0ABT2JSM1_9ACTN|nr:zinc ABC transporter ATP-binding protein AztA [Streptomyces gossypii]MCT2590858.1 metal ABC transporter ATP-binding protein [Streptomyces gossypii]
MVDTPEASAITLRGVSAGYGSRRVLHQFHGAIPALADTVVVGPNGSGKSTLLGVIAGVTPTTAGTVQHGAGMGTGCGMGTGMGSAARPAFVVQRSAVSDVLPLTARDTVAMGRWDRLGLWKRLSARDWSVVDTSMERLGVRDLAGRQLGELSGGQRQRVLVAQGLAQEAGLILLDEPTTGLDLAAQRRIAQVIGEVKSEGVTVVQATHDLAAARRADHCLLLQDGRLVGEGAPAAVLTDAALEEVWQLPRRV